MISVWSDTSSLPSFESLKKDIKTDVLVIGGGMAGILCAYCLKNAGVNCIVVEAERICGGITKNTTAKITSQHGFIYSGLISKFGEEKAKMYLEANEAAIKKFALFCAGLDCDFEMKDAYCYCLDNEDKVQKELSAIEKLGYEAFFAKKLPLPFTVAGAVRFAKQAQFNPLKFAEVIVPKLEIYENTAVRELKGHTAATDGGNITAENIIVATHFPFINKHGLYFLKMYQHRSYCIALENAPDVAGMYVDEAQKGMSFRNYKNLLIIGGGDHRTGKKGGNWRELEAFTERHYPNSEEKYRWATQDCMTLDSVPYIGHYSKNTPYMYVATGFNKWGMTSSMVSAMLLTDMISGKANDFTPVFSPSRSILRAQLLSNAGHAIINLLTPVPKRCPHLGCALKYNKTEHSWDCPCHGSRFTEEGKLIDNPATGNLKCYKELNKN